MKPVTFWFEFASPYSYLAAERLRSERRRPPQMVWRPFLLGPILQSQGSPFAASSAKAAYVWRDVARLADRQGLALQRPHPFPQNGLRAARIATAFAAEPWLADFVCAVFRAEFAHGHHLADEETLRDVLDGMGLPTAAILDEAERAETKAALRAQTEQAQALGIFGAPSFTVERELFWGQDRLDDALAWAKA